MEGRVEVGHPSKRMNDAPTLPWLLIESSRTLNAKKKGRNPDVAQDSDLAGSSVDVAQVALRSVNGRPL